MKIRILPIVIFVAFTSIVVKLFDAVIDSANRPDDASVSRFHALAAEEGEKVEEQKPAEPREEDGAVLSDGYSGAGPKELEVTNMSEMERNLLENLAKRRKELEEWSASIATKENILNATEKKINRKMGELDELKADVSALLNAYNEKENKKIMRLVKIYENMKAQNAADIFDKMEIGILLEIISNMKEAKAAKILSKINSSKAKEITIKLAEQRRMFVN